ncbi:hypothetical protein SynRCC2555_50012 [Synechococcus sp. WH 8101]|nr:hypothetical protein SynRCC2555_50012 [Synechococcus sp. WH 8101]
MKVGHILITSIAIASGFFVSRCAKHQHQLSRPVETESIPAGYSYEGRFGQGKDFYSKLKTRSGSIVEISGYRISSRGEVRANIEYAVNCRLSLRRWKGKWAPIEKDSLAEAFHNRYCLAQ